MIKYLPDLKMNPNDTASVCLRDVTSVEAVSSRTEPVSSGQRVRKGGGENG
jgi:hypothetical protein